MPQQQWSSAKAKVQLRLSVQRLRTLQQKKEAQAKAARREIATLIERGKLETSRIKVETLINDDIYIELLELLELYCELLIARFALLDSTHAKEPDPGVAEGVYAVVHAALRTEVKELHVVRELLMSKFGREFSIAAIENKDGCVSERVVKKLSTATPSPELVDAYMSEIARAYGVPYQSAITAATESHADKEVDEVPPRIDTESTEDDSLVVAPAPKLPSLPPTEGSTPKGEKSADGSNTAEKTKNLKAEPEEDDFDALVRRFTALKKR